MSSKVSLNVGDQAPEINLPDDHGNQTKLSDLKGHNVVVYFYPKDDTPGCTKEACSFSDNLKSLDELEAKVFGISKCSVANHAKFKDKYSLKFPLLSDESGDVCERYGTWGEKSMYGRTYMGITRATYLIDKDGKIAHIWPSVKVAGHTEDVMEALKKLDN